MNKIIIIACILICCISHSQAQNYTITGKVVDADTKKPLELASVTFDPKGNTKSIGGITNRKGKFEIEVPKGEYTIVVEFLGYKTITFKSQKIINNVHYGSIELSIDTELLKELKLTVKKRTVELRPKKLIYNIGKDIAANGGTITDALNNIPSVTVKNGEATIRGQRATIMIDGKTTSLTKGDALKSLPPGSVAKVEIIKNPGAKYKAKYKSILNIITKIKNEGLNASITGTGGYQDIFGSLLSVNKKTKQINFYVNTYYYHKNVVKISNANNKYLSGGIPTNFLNEDSNFDSKNDGLNNSIGADFYLSEKTTLTTSMNYSRIDHDSETLTNTSILDAAMAETLANRRIHLGSYDDVILELYADVKHNLNKEGRSITSYLKHTNDYETYVNDISNSNANFTDELYSQKIKLLNTEFDIKYKTPLKEKTTLTVGYNADLGKLPFRTTETNKNLDYIQNVHAIFADYEYEADKFYVGVGLRGEFTKTTVDYLDINMYTKKIKNNIFPSFYSQYALSDSETISLSYGMSIKRPDYRRLQPFEEKYSETSSYKGNENLNPLYVDSYGLDYAYYGNKFTVMPSLFYSRYRDFWENVTYPTGELIGGVNKIITTPQNVGTLDYYGLDFTTTYKASKKLDFTFNSLLYYHNRHGVFETTDVLNQPVVINYTYNGLNGVFKLITQLKLKKMANFQVSVFHYLKSTGPVSVRKKYTYASLAINKDLFDKKATLSLNINDVFNSNKTERDRFLDNYFSSSLIKNKYPNIVLSFTYRFNESKNKKKIDFDNKDIQPNY